VEYIRQDVEGSDSDTRRRAACELIRGLCKQFQQETSAHCLGYVQSMLAEYQQDVANRWQAKDTVITMVLALTVKGSTRAHGVSSTNELINVMDFFNGHIFPELLTDVEALPIVKADAIKFVSTFRNQLAAQGDSVLVQCMPVLIAHLKSSQYVVHTYAAQCIERFLVMKSTTSADGAPRITQVQSINSTIHH
jgi:exportin-2 (importin alpha re-exporter)